MKPWHTVVTPREDIRLGKSLDAAEFAVHLDSIRQGKGPSVYQNPQEFFQRTFLTTGLLELASQVVRRLSGVTVQSSPVFNMTTQFGGGKTHALTMLYHLAQLGPDAAGLTGVNRILKAADVEKIPQAAIAIFVGMEFDSLNGRGGSDGTPKRKTPWGEIAWQLGGIDAYRVVEKHDQEMIEPKGDVIRQMLPRDRPVLILMDEIVSYISTYRRKGYHDSLYNFTQALSEVARGEKSMALVVSIPASTLEYTADDEEDEKRFQKMLDRLGKPIMMSSDNETSEIIRRRLFEWESGVTELHRVILPREAIQTCENYAKWVQQNRSQIPGWFPADQAVDQFKSAYPFHPSLLSVFERKWQSLPRFQRTRGVLRLLALWVANAYKTGFESAHKDAFITTGSAPLDDPLFRAAIYEQLGETKLEAAVTTDICGRKDSHAIRLDAEAIDAIKKSRLHRKVATTVLFESNGGQTKDAATIPELRLSCGDPDIDLGNIETALDALTNSCYYLTADRTSYRFSLQPNLNKLLADRKASIDSPGIAEVIRSEIQAVIAQAADIERCFFPQKSNDIPDRAAVSLVVMAPEVATLTTEERNKLINNYLRESGSSNRTYKNALIFVVPESAEGLQESARRVLAWRALKAEEKTLRLDDVQSRILLENEKKAHRDLKEEVWRAYRYLYLLGKSEDLREINLGQLNSSMASSYTGYVVTKLQQADELVSRLAPNRIANNWAPAFAEWSTKRIRDAFYASATLPRVSNHAVIADAIFRGVTEGLFALVGKSADAYIPFCYKDAKDSISQATFEFSDDLFLIQRDTAEAYLASIRNPPAVVSPPATKDTQPSSSESPPSAAETKSAKYIRWKGILPAQKWMNFYTKLLTKFVQDPSLKIEISIQATPADGLSTHKIDEAKAALRELGLPENIESE